VKVYIISDYAEDGAEGVHATLNKNEVINIWDRKYKSYHNGVILDKYIKNYEEEKKKLLQLIEEDEINMDGYNIGAGWGGTMLHIIEAE